MSYERLPFDSQKRLRRLAAYLERPDEEIDLCEGALLIAEAHYPQLQISEYLKRIDDMASAIRPYLHVAHTPEQQIGMINACLYDDQRFTGNTLDYDDPRNSFLNEVLDRKTGLPITLSFLYVSIAERLGAPIVPLGMPYHFIVRYETGGAGIYVDPFYSGAILTEEACYRRMEQAAGHLIAPDPAYLQPTPKRIALYRLLNNLKRRYLETDDRPAAERVLQQLLVIIPQSYPNLRELGKIALREKRYEEAIQSLQKYLDAEPNAPDALQIQEMLVQAHRLRLARN